MKDWVAPMMNTEEMQGRYEVGRSADGERHRGEGCRDDDNAGLVEGVSTREGEVITDVDCFCVGHGLSATGNEQRGGLGDWRRNSRT